MDEPTSQQWLAAVTELRTELQRLADRVGALEQSQSRESQRLAAARAPHVDAELVAAIGAAVAAYLGVKARVRRIHVVGSASWSQQGRATIQASHDLRPASAWSTP